MTGADSIKVTCAIVEKDGLVLVTQRSLSMSQPLMWEFLGGKIEQVEAEKACLVREVKEELQISIEPHTRLTPVRHDYQQFRIELIPYSCRYLEGELQLAEHVAYEWATPAALKSYNWCPADVPVVEEYLQLKKKIGTEGMVAGAASFPVINL